jgi:hypothetical protein
MDRAHEIGDLCVAGDWACVHGDLQGLARIATRLAAFVGAPLHHELLALAALRSGDLQQAVDRWPRLRDRMFDEGGRPSP